MVRATPVASIPKIVAASRQAFDKGALRTVAQRKDAIRKVATMVKEREADFVAATREDMSKPAFETKVTELAMVLHEAYNALDNLDAWTAPQKVELEGIQHLDTQYIRRDPLGVVLIIGAWNYPLQLTLVGMVGAIAGGNTVVLKPSELAPATSKILTEMLPKYLPAEVATVVEGAIDETTALLNERFDHILYTGSSRVAKIIMAAASKHLTPVTLELGGKSPCIVDSGVDLETTARRIMWGRLVNCGQTCIAPDYILVKPSMKGKLVAELAKARESFMGPDPQQSKDYGRIINDMHFDRLVGLMKGGKVVLGGEHDKKTRFIAPTVLDNVDLNSPLMTDEIFGPLLPLVPYETIDDAIAFINAREKPLALYIFSNDKSAVQKVETLTSSGAYSVNDCLMHAAVAGLPFGGVGHSGMGAYHGKHTFTTFTHPKAVLKKQLAMEVANNLTRYPPYTDRKYNIIMAAIGRTKEKSPLLAMVFYSIVAAAVATAVFVARRAGGVADV
uniref:Aldehyde dehydrogenase n=1 Tax=Neobodo designis TaxID=312471 RepID=A0A7S1QZ24_NEODS|mmetsp:Transcript_54799/g.168906  ORF Transcript_54799/g.168906 Transcript_54799/m.168906 type:complete len:504 (+) Transcript_54799:41-1552(+)|eukprot:CAMPEP_0174855576 /NCGR_PEP_ID=MMETSP1114-20130205/33610_1 /TAXON_ID=312471 /ORGANISM="Neobodo designis, Strain CCAP 1951/1" /LENGTH=503 /DNA_ID=CAMNT_0016090317 /DNA_START=41 /DNA_END=1552 /DNA_ORIENTATION=+